MLLLAGLRLNAMKTRHKLNEIPGTNSPGRQLNEYLWHPSEMHQHVPLISLIVLIMGCFYWPGHFFKNPLLY